ncbi:MAG: hypothetical protein AABX47_03590 [Nanoarchaeota archaeon]
MASAQGGIVQSDELIAASCALDEAIEGLRKFGEQYVVLYGRPVPRSLIEQEYRQSAQLQLLEVLQGFLLVNGFCIEPPRGRPAPSIYETPYPITRPIHLFGFNVADRQAESVLLTCKNGNHKHTGLQEILSDPIEFRIRDKREQRMLEDSYKRMIEAYNL